MALPAQARTVVAFVFAATLIFIWIVAGSLVSWTLDNWRSMQVTEPRIARLAGYAAVEDRLRETVAAIAQQSDLLAFPAALESSQAGAQLQQQLRGFAETAGLTVRGSQLVQRRIADEERPYDKLTVQLNMLGEPVAIDDFLSRVHASEPLLMIESLDLSRQRMTARERRRRQSTNSLNEAELTIVTRITAARLVAP